MLPYYAARFPTVEINYTFYRMPNEKLVGRLGRADAVALQADAEGAAAHHARQPAEELRRRSSAAFCEVAGTLGDKLGALLFQLPPNLKKDLGALRRVSRRPAAAVLRARSSSGTRRGWTTRSVRAAGRSATWRCASPTARSCRRRCAITADYAYFRLRDEGYTADDIGAGPTRSRATRRRAATCSSTSSTRTRAKGPSSRGC